jgi:hypothetical protein
MATRSAESDQARRRAGEIIASLAYLLGLALALPVAALAAFFVLISHTAAQPTLPALLIDLLRHAYQALIWGIGLTAASLSALVVAGFFTRSRRIGALIIIVVTIASLAILLAGAGLPREPGEAFFHLLGLLAILIAARCLSPTSFIFHQRRVISDGNDESRN